MILYRRAAQSQTIISAEQTSGFGGESPGILDRLGFVENAVVKTQIFELECITPQRTVRRKHDIIAIEVISWFQPRTACVIEHAQLGREARGFGLPMKHERAWHNHE